MTIGKSVRTKGHTVVILSVESRISRRSKHAPLLWVSFLPSWRETIKIGKAFSRTSDASTEHMSLIILEDIIRKDGWSEQPISIKEYIKSSKILKVISLFRFNIRQTAFSIRSALVFPTVSALIDDSSRGQSRSQTGFKSCSVFSLRKFLTREPITTVAAVQLGSLSSSRRLQRLFKTFKNVF